MPQNIRLKVDPKTNTTPHIIEISDVLIKSFETVTYSLASAGFIGISLLQLLAAIFAILNSKVSDALSNTLGSSVCIIAAYHYQWMREKMNDSSGIVATRYSDWYITTILMLIEFFNLAGTLETRWEWLLGACLSCELMVIGGHVSTVFKENRHSFIITYSISIIFSLILLVCYICGTVVDIEHENNWMHIFFALWAFYPFAFWANKYKNISYNLLDIYSKGIFGIVLGLITFTKN